MEGDQTEPLQFPPILFFSFRLNRTEEQSNKKRNKIIYTAYYIDEDTTYSVIYLFILLIGDNLFVLIESCYNCMEYAIVKGTYSLILLSVHFIFIATVSLLFENPLISNFNCYRFPSPTLSFLVATSPHFLYSTNHISLIISSSLSLFISPGDCCN